jgi:D-tyrosyl-tRNA(Tyr) deacylase
LIGLLQRVGEARVQVAGKTVGVIGRGLLVLIGVQKGDDQGRADRLLARLLGYRVFPDAENRMNLSLRDIDGGLLLVPQLTLAADTRKGTRASFTKAAPPEDGRRLFDYLVEKAGREHPQVRAGIFGAEMQVVLTCEGPVTFWLET